MPCRWARCRPRPDSSANCSAGIRRCRSCSPRSRRPARSGRGRCSRRACRSATCRTTCRAPSAVSSTGLRRRRWSSSRPRSGPRCTTSSDSGGFRCCSAAHAFRRGPSIATGAWPRCSAIRLSHGILIGAQTPADADRFRAIGAAPDRVQVTGNIKYDLAIPAATVDAGRALRQQWGAGAAGLDRRQHARR